MYRRPFVLLAISFIFASPAFGAAKPIFQKPGPVHLDKAGEKWAAKSLKKMTLEQKVGQMFMIWSRAEFLNVNSHEYLSLRDTMRKYHLGGFGLTVEYEDGFLYKNEPLEAAMVTNQLQKDSEFPLHLRCRFRARPGHASERGHGIPARHGLRRHQQSRLRPPSPDASPPWKRAPSGCSGTGSPTSM